MGALKVPPIVSARELAWFLAASSATIWSRINIGVGIANSYCERLPLLNEAGRTNPGEPDQGLAHARYRHRRHLRRWRGIVGE